MTSGAHRPLNFHHLHYFWTVAHRGKLALAAKELRLSPSALSTQIRLLEEDLGEALFVRSARRLVLTEAGQLALGYADDILARGQELATVMRRGRARDDLLRVGAVSTLSRNFQESFLRPLLGDEQIRLRIVSGAMTDLVARLEAHELDLILANRAARSSESTSLKNRKLARQKVSLVGRTRPRAFKFRRDVGNHALIVPSAESAVRSEFEALCASLGVRLRIFAEVDDMATMRLLARDVRALVLVPTVVVRDELRAGELHEWCVVPDVEETFYAITGDRRFQHPRLRTLLARDEADLLAMGR